MFLDLALFLLEQVEKGMSTVVGLVRQYEHETATVQSLVGGKVAVPKEKVYPKLEALGTLHTLLLQDRRMLVRDREETRGPRPTSIQSIAALTVPWAQRSLHRWFCRASRRHWHASARATSRR